MFDALIYRVVGAPPASGASRVVRLRWVQKFYRFNLLPGVASSRSVPDRAPPAPR
jgi:hypothetical protein